MYTQLSRGARGLIFGLSFHEGPSFECVSSKSSWQDCTFVQAHLRLHCSHMKLQSNSINLKFLGLGFISNYQLFEFEGGRHKHM